MKSFRINLEDRVQIGRTSSKSLSHGRPKKGVLRKKIYKMEPIDIENKFYLKIANIEEKEIQKFIHDYQITLPWVKDGTNFAKLKDILDFQKDIKFIVENIKVFKIMKGNKLANTYERIYEKTNGLPEILNKYLADCHLQISFPPVIRRLLSKEDLNSYKNQIKNPEPQLKGLLRDNVFSRSSGGTNFSNLFCRCNSMLSWCILDLITDLLIKDEHIRVCENCGMIFEVKNLKSKYCQDAKCKKEVDKIRQRRSRSH